MKKVISIILCLVMAAFCGVAGFSALADGSVSATLERDGNNAYLPFGWIYRARDDDFIVEKLEQIKSFGIDTVYFSIGAYTLDGDTLTDGVEERKNLGIWTNVGHWMSLAGRYSIDVIPIIDCRVNDSFIENGDIVLAALSAAVADIVSEGFVYSGRAYRPTGVHFDCEPFRRPYQPFYLSALSAIREQLPTGMTLSSATPAHNGAWSDAYLAEAGAYLDMVNPMLYDSNGPSDWGTLADGVTQTRAEYIELVRSTCLWYTRVFEENAIDCEISPTVPAYADASTETSGEGWPDSSSKLIWYHLNYNSLTGETLETVENCIAGVESAVSEGAAVTKLGIWNYYYFCGDDEEYQTTVNPYYDPQADQSAWLGFVNKSVSGVLSDSGISYDETLDSFSNPERGFYRPVLLKLPKEGGAAVGSSASFVHLRVGLSSVSPVNNEGAEPALTQNMLDILSATLSNLRESNATVVIRFAYDSFYGIKDREPSIDTIKAHIAQLQPVFYEYGDILASIEAGFIGPWGEMHTSSMATVSNFNAIIDALLNAAPVNVGITVRRPKFYADMFGIRLSELDTDVSVRGTDAYRVGVYNDGYLGSKSDLGTFSNRDKETAWLSNQAKHTLYGGEAVLEGGVRSYNCIEYISQEMFVTHTSYLNSQWNDKLIGYWKNDEVYNGADTLYAGQTAYKYISNHLGYRYVIRDCDITKQVRPGGAFIVNIKVENVGCGNMVKPKRAQLIFVQGDNTYTADLNTDVRCWDSRALSEELVAVNIPAALADGECEVYLRVANSGTLGAVRFANAEVWNEAISANYIGSFTVGDFEEPTTEATTEPTTEPTTEATTEPTTEATTEPTTEATTEPTTEATTEATTEPTTEATTEATTEPQGDEGCSCLCHSDGIMGVIYKIIIFFSKLFNVNRVCKCGQLHY